MIRQRMAYPTWAENTPNVTDRPLFWAELGHGWGCTDPEADHWLYGFTDGGGYGTGRTRMDLRGGDGKSPTMWDGGKV